MASLREEIEAILVDSYGEDQQWSAWEVAFTDGVEIPFGASLLGVPVEVQGFRLNKVNVLQCLVVREQRQRWVGIEDLDEESLPEEFRHLRTLYRAWVKGSY